MIFFRKIPKILFGALSALVQVANLFSGNIVIYEVTEGINFDWIALLRNRMFWIILIFTVVYYIVAYIVQQQNGQVDSGLENELLGNSVKILDLVTENAKRGDFESSKKALKIFDQIQKRRGR